MVSNIERGHNEDRAMDDRLSQVKRAEIYESRCDCIIGDLDEMLEATKNYCDYQQISKRYETVERQLKQIRKLAEKLLRRAIAEAEAEVARGKA